MPIAPITIRSFGAAAGLWPCNATDLTDGATAQAPNRAALPANCRLERGPFFGIIILLLFDNHAAIADCQPISYP
jgi:hypothetical protein